MQPWLSQLGQLAGRLRGAGARIGRLTGGHSRALARHRQFRRATWTWWLLCMNSAGRAEQRSVFRRRGANRHDGWHCAFPPSLLSSSEANGLLTVPVGMIVLDLGDCCPMDCAMSWKSWLFPSRPSTSSIGSPQVLIEQYIRAAQRDASALMGPVGALAVPIVAGSWRCTQAVTPYLKPNQERFTKEPLIQQSYVLNEFLYFFIHIMKRHANDQLSAENSKKLQAMILPLVVRSAAVDAFFAHWPQEYRSGIERDFYKILDDVEEEYTTRTEQLVARGDIYVGPIPPQFANLRVELALSSRLALSVLDLAGYEVEEGRPAHERDFPFASMVAGEAMKVLSAGDLRNYRELVARASGAITVYESSTQTPLTEFMREFWAQQA